MTGRCTCGHVWQMHGPDDARQGACDACVVFVDVELPGQVRIGDPS